MRVAVWLKAVAIAGIGAGALHAQDRPQFEVAAIRENPQAADGGFVRFMPDGGIRAQLMSPSGLISIALELDAWQVVGAPAWAGRVRYDIEAKPPAPATRAQTYLMMQRMLEDRFGFRMHRERREIDAFALTRLRPDRLGDGMTVSSLDCTVAPLPAACPRAPFVEGEFKPVGVGVRRLVQRLQAQLKAPVGDETQLTGLYDFNLVWTDDPATFADRAALTTALQEQLGLRLDRRRVTVDVIVVDRIERPTPN